MSEIEFGPEGINRSPQPVLLTPCTRTDSDVNHVAEECVPCLVQQDEDEPDQGQQPAKSMSTQLVEIALDRYELHISQDGYPFGIPTSGLIRTKPMAGSSRGLRTELAAQYYDLVGRTPSGSALSEALTTLEGMAFRSQPVDVHLRVARCDGRLFIDLGTASGEFIEVDDQGWRLVSNAPVHFRRSRLTGELPVPIVGGSLEELWDIINVKESLRPLILAALVTGLFPDVPRPILAVTGEHGTGKTTAAKVLVTLIDPGPVPLRGAPKDLREWPVMLHNSYAVGLDNVSFISHEFSDALCRAVTGDGLVKRELYSDLEVIPMSFQRMIVLNGIAFAELRGDLADRIVMCEVERIDPSLMRTEQEHARLWEQAHPRILGALLTLASQVMAKLPEIELVATPRMADYSRILAAVDEILGTSGFRTYDSIRGNRASDAASADVVATEILACIEVGFDGSSKQLMDRLDRDFHGSRRQRDWPSSPARMTNHLKRIAPVLRMAGWAIEDHFDPGHKVTKWRITPPAAQYVDPEDPWSDA